MAEIIRRRGLGEVRLKGFSERVGSVSWRVVIETPKGPLGLGRILAFW